MDNHELPSHVWVTENGITSIDFMVTAFEEVRIVVLPKGVESGDVVGGFGYKIRIPEVIPELLKEMEMLEMIDMPLSAPLKAGKEYIFHFKAKPKEQWAM